MPPRQQVPWTENTQARCVHLLDLYRHVLRSFNLTHSVNLVSFNNFDNARLEQLRCHWESLYSEACNARDILPPSFMREIARIRQCITIAQENQESGEDDAAEEGWW